MQSYENFINLRHKAKAIYDLVKLVIFILYIAHFTGCLFYALAIWEEEKEVNK